MSKQYFAKLIDRTIDLDRERALEDVRSVEQVNGVNLEVVSARKSPRMSK